MSLRAFRKIHYWTAIVTALPLGIVLLSGILLQLKKQWHWVQPPTQQGSAAALNTDYATILKRCQSVPQAGIENWSDIDRLDIRPGRGVIKVRGKNHWEIQIDAATGAVLHSAIRRSDWIESLHDGSYFSNTLKNGLFLPAAFITLALYISGLRLFFRRRRSVQIPVKRIES